MSNASQRGALEYEAETVFGEDVTTFATHRPAILDVFDMSGVKQDKIDSGHITQYLQEGTQHFLGPFDIAFSTDIWLTGHGVTTAGSPTVNAMETFLSYAFGNPTATGLLSAAASTTFTGGTATAPTTTASATFTAGGMFRDGVKGDGKGDGQMNVVGTHVTTTLTPLFALKAVPANGQLLLPTVDFWLPETASSAATTVTGLRMRYRTANLAKEFHGCFPKTLEFSGVNTRGIPRLKIGWGAAWFRYTATSGVSAVAQTAYNPAPVAGGSYCLNGVGTATRVERTIRDFKLSVDLGIRPLEGPGGANSYQTIIGAKRVPSTIKVSWTEDADAATATPVLDGFFTGTTPKHALYTLNTTAGSAVGLYFPNLCITGARPVQIANDDVNRLAIEAMAYTGPTTTSERTLSAMRMGWG